MESGGLHWWCLEEPPVRPQELLKDLTLLPPCETEKEGKKKEREKKENPDLLLIVVKTSKIVGFFFQSSSFNSKITCIYSCSQSQRPVSIACERSPRARPQPALLSEAFFRPGSLVPLLQRW